jgi:hypothetical protein
MKRHHNKQLLRKSILDVKDASSLHCLAAVNYFQVGTRTVVLWLSTTLEAPPVDSRNVTWRKLGLATYLLCMLVKQHTGFCTGGTLSVSLLSLQASRLRDNPVHRFYFKLGFQCHDLEDNGLSLLHYAFQIAVYAHPKIWVAPKREAMSLFQLHDGLPQRMRNIHLTPDSDSNSASTWKLHFYAKIFMAMHRHEDD